MENMLIKFLPLLFVLLPFIFLCFSVYRFIKKYGTDYKKSPDYAKRSGRVESIFICFLCLSITTGTHFLPLASNLVVLIPLEIVVLFIVSIIAFSKRLEKDSRRKRIE